VIVAAAISLIWSFVAIRLGPKIGYLDRPDDPVLKTHEHPAVPLGGVGIFLGVNIAAMTRGGLDLTLFLATGIVLVLGLVDDRRGLPPVVRLLVELAAALILVMGSSRSEDGPLVVVFGVVLVVFAINAVNLFDGLDGLAASVALVTALGLAWLAGGLGLDNVLSLEMAAALGGFLVFGWHPARVFLGDAGAYVVGALLAWVILEVSPGGPIQLIVTAGMLGVFAIDLVVTFLRRMRGGRPLFIGDRSHVYDQLRDRGWSVPVVALSMAAAQAVIALIVVGVDRLLAPWPSFFVLAVILIVTLAALLRLGFLSPQAR
jgi:UDP-GlcNAc:undecaprenyl-phosphate/decaprenyl-phosphate GlcNAc-1-phosphate transferase